MTENYFREDLNRCGFSSRSLSNAWRSLGMTSFSISSVRSGVRSLTGRWVSSKRSDRLYFSFTALKDYFFFFSPRAASFLRNSAILLLGTCRVGRARISSQVISGMDLMFLEFGLVVIFSDLRLMLCNNYPINN